MKDSKRGALDTAKKMEENAMREIQKLGNFIKILKKHF